MKTSDDNQNQQPHEDGAPNDTASTEAPSGVPSEKTGTEDASTPETAPEIVDKQETAAQPPEADAETPSLALVPVPSKSSKGERFRVFWAHVRSRARQGWVRARMLSGRCWVAARPRCKQAYTYVREHAPGWGEKLSRFLEFIRPWFHKLFVWSREVLPHIPIDQALVCGVCRILTVWRFGREMSAGAQFFWRNAIRLFFLLPAYVIVAAPFSSESMLSDMWKALVFGNAMCGLYGAISLLFPVIYEQLPAHHRAIQNAVALRWGLYRLPEAGWIGGVCAGIAQARGMSVDRVRLAFLAALVLIPGYAIFAYALLQTFLKTEGETEGLLGVIQQVLQEEEGV